MDENIKVKELPQDQQDEILKEAQAYSIPGILIDLVVSDLKQKIEEAKNASDNSKQNVANDLEEDKHDEADADNPYKEWDYISVKNEAETRKLETIDKKRPTLEAALIADDRVKNTANVNNTIPENKPDNESPKQVQDDKYSPDEIKPDGICCICYQKVFNKVCSGCGRVYS